MLANIIRVYEQENILSLPTPSMSFSPFAILTAEEMNDLVENDQALAAGTGLDNGSVTKNKFSTSTGELGGAWSTWTPSYLNLTVGNGTVVARYLQVGKTVFFRFSLTWGSTTTFTSGSNISISPPVNMSSNYTQFTTLGTASYFDTSAGAVYSSGIAFNSPTSMLPFVTSASGTYTSYGQVNNTNPMTWATGDTFSLVGSFEAA